MLNIKKILVPLDLSQSSLMVLPFACELARVQGATLMLAHIENVKDGKKCNVTQWPSMGSFCEHLPSLQRQTIQQTHSHVSDDILELAQREEVDLIAMATHGRTGLARALMGSTAEAVVRKAKCPVMVTRVPTQDFVLPPEGELQGGVPIAQEVAVLNLRHRPPSQEDVYFAKMDRDKIQAAARRRAAELATPTQRLRLNVERILVPTDFSDESAVALSYATEWARAFGAAVQLLYVEENILDSSAPPLGWMSGDADVTQVRAVREKLEHLQSQMGDVSCEVGVSFGIPKRAIVAVACTCNVDLIVMATHGRTGISRAVLGSTTEAVVRHAPCPVIALRGTGALALQKGEKEVVARGITG